MTEASEPLVLVAMDGRTLPHSQAVLVHALSGWHVVLFCVPRQSCPPVQRESEIALETSAGYRYRGHVTADLMTDNGAYVLLTGIGPLAEVDSADAV